MSNENVCWKCGAAIDDLPLPLARLAECTECGTDLHVCRMCRFYDTAMSNQCQEPIAEEVKRKESSNFCEYFQLKADAFSAQENTEAQAAKAQLQDIFGVDVNSMQSPDSADAAQEELNKLFGIDDTKEK